MNNPARWWGPRPDKRAPTHVDELNDQRAALGRPPLAVVLTDYDLERIAGYLATDEHGKTKGYGPGTSYPTSITLPFCRCGRETIRCGHGLEHKMPPDAQPSPEDAAAFRAVHGPGVP